MQKPSITSFDSLSSGGSINSGSFIPAVISSNKSKMKSSNKKPHKNKIQLKSISQLSKIVPADLDKSPYRYHRAFNGMNINSLETSPKSEQKKQTDIYDYTRFK